MKTFATWLALTGMATAGWGQPSGAYAVPQTARQALIEMFFSKTSGTFMKHLPVATHTALEKSGAMNALQQYSLLAAQAQTTGRNFETFETGSVLLASDDPKTGQRFEAVLENDSLQGDDDNIEVSFRVYKDKQLQPTLFLPRISFAMKLEFGIWRLNEILITERLPLADPGFLKSITEGMQSRAISPAMPAQPQNSATTFASDASVMAGMRTIVAGEGTYSRTYPSVGYTCTLFDLDGFGEGERGERHAMMISSSLASGKKYGYVFSLSGCTGSPATGVHLVATPAANTYGRRAFCTDQTGTIRASADGNGATCLAGGSPAE